MTEARRLTELEGAVLGVVWSRGPITAYGVRQRFVRSTTRGWSSSTGAIYPAIERLTRYGYVSGTADPNDGRSSRLLETTADGVAALRSWVRDLDDWMGGAVVDPVRTRVNYIAVLPDAEVAAFVAQAEGNARSALQEMRGYEGDPASRHRTPLLAAHAGAEMEVEARLAWLDRIRGMLLKR
jgi:DNA-binding PadR family transcriptional regulator